MIDFSEIIELCQAEALSDKFDPTQISIWENICRTYSKKFFTPLHEVLKMDVEFVLRQIYADQMDEANFEEHLDDLVDLLNHLEDPDYDSDAEKDLQKFIKEAEEEEKERIANRLPLKSIFKKGHELKKPKIILAEELPKSGGINLAHLVDDENER